MSSFPNTNYFPILILGIVFFRAIVACTGATSAKDAETPVFTSGPMVSVLSKFTAADVPTMGAGELPVDVPTWKAIPELVIAHAPSKGASQRPMLYIGEGNNTMYVVNQGKVIWAYSTGKGWEFDDIWMLSNGNILFSRMSYAEEITPQKKVVWHFDAPAGTEIHTVQPVGLDKVLLVENGLPPKLIILNIKTGAIEVEHALPAVSSTDRKTVHGQFRRMRMTEQGTYLAAFLGWGKVVEYDKDFNEIWSYAIPTPWAAIRLHNGNTLITDEKDRLTREVNSRGETVWEFKLSELPASHGCPVKLCTERRKSLTSYIS